MCLSLLSHMSAFTQVVHFTRLHLLPLQMWFRRAYHPEFSGQVGALFFTSPRFLVLVRVPTRCVPRNPLHSAVSDQVSGYRHFPSVLEGTSGLVEGAGPGVGTGSLTVYQCVGTSGHPQCMSCLPRPHPDTQCFTYSPTIPPQYTM